MIEVSMTAAVMTPIACLVLGFAAGFFAGIVLAEKPRPRRFDYLEPNDREALEDELLSVGRK